VIFDPDGQVLAERAEEIALCTSNEAEYEGLLLALNTAHELGVTDLEIFSDSQLVVNQINEKWRIKEIRLKELWSKCVQTASWFDSISLSWVRREKNARADYLCSQLLDEIEPRRSGPRRPAWSS
jgi:probable phosphoglycerate mutase